MCFAALRQPHKLEQLSGNNIETLAEKMDINSMYTRLFEPILIPRVVGTKGHTKVKNVCGMIAQNPVDLRLSCRAREW